MADLWATRRAESVARAAPLAARMRPRALDDIAGQQHILADGRILRRMIAAKSLTSLILFGPPGTGKTTLAECIGAALNWTLERENASVVGVARIREILESARRRLGDDGRRTILFLDEIHRFNKNQQDVLLGDVERGVITLIGATTENPLFAVNSALVSRSTLLRLEPLTEADITALLRRAIADPERGYGRLNIQADDDALAVWATKCDGDARRALTALEVAVLSSQSPRPAPARRQQEPLHDADRTDLRGVRDHPERDGNLPHQAGGAQGEAAAATTAPTPLIHITRAVAEDSIQQKAAVYADDEHYDAASAMIKSVRGSDPDAALYWIARMLEGGEDPRFIARRLAILASEDIGNADPRAIMVADAAWSLVERIGLPEARITLAQCAIYLALAPKSNASYAAIDAALADVREGRTVAVPRHIKDGNVRKAGDLSAGTSRQGEGYAYTHEAGVASDALGVIGTQDYLGVDKRYYHPTDHGSEKTLKERLEETLRARGRSV